MLSDNKVNLCMECGCCSFVCPANRPLVQTNKLSKELLKEERKKAIAEAMGCSVDKVEELMSINTFVLSIKASINPVALSI